jgi:hypothetical protein
LTFKYTQLLDGLVLPTSTGNPVEQTNLLMGPCYDKILWFAHDASAAVLGGPGVGKYLLAPGGLTSIAGKNYHAIANIGLLGLHEKLRPRKEISGGRAYILSIIVIADLVYCFNSKLNW